MQMNSTSMMRNPHPYYFFDSKSSSTVQKLNQYTRPELKQLRQKNLQLLSNQSMVNTLPDKGAKLKETNDMIDRLLLDSSTISSLDEITAENTNPLECPLTKKLDEMSVLTPHQGARKRSVDLANHQASYHYTSNSLLLKRQSKRPSLSMLQRPCYIQHTNDEPHAKVRMLSLDESMTLQQEQQSSVMKSDQYFDDQVPSRNLLNSLNLSVNVIQDINFDHIEFPKHEFDESEDEDRMEE